MTVLLNPARAARGPRLRPPRWTSPISAAIGMAVDPPRRQVLQSVDLQITPGEVVLLTGPSGCEQNHTPDLDRRPPSKVPARSDLRVFGQQLHGGWSPSAAAKLRAQRGNDFPGPQSAALPDGGPERSRWGADSAGRFQLPGTSRSGQGMAAEAAGLEDHLNKLPQDLSGGPEATCGHCPCVGGTSLACFSRMNPPLHSTAPRAVKWWNC